MVNVCSGMKLSEKLKNIIGDEKYQLLFSDSMLEKRPLIITDKTAPAGFKYWF